MRNEEKRKEKERNVRRNKKVKIIIDKIKKDYKEKRKKTKIE